MNEQLQLDLSDLQSKKSDVQFPKGSFNTYCSRKREITSVSSKNTFNHGQRKQNQLLISINCSKAIDHNHLQELADIMQSNRNEMQNGKEQRSSSVVIGDTASSSKYIGKKPNTLRNSTVINSITREHRGSIESRGTPSQLNQSQITSHNDYCSPQKDKEVKTRETRQVKDAATIRRSHNTINHTKLKYIQDNIVTDSSRKSVRVDSMDGQRICVTEVSPLKTDNQNKVATKSFNQLIQNNKERLKRILGNDYQDGEDNENRNGSVQGQRSFDIGVKPQLHTVMYNRAMKRLKNSLNQKGLDEKSMERNSFDLYHFHIDAFNNQIQMNKFETQATTKVNSSMTRQITQIQRAYPAYPVPSIREFNSDTNMHIQEIEDEEDQVSESLFKMSPHFKKRGTKNIDKGGFLNLKPLHDTSEHGLVKDFMDEDQKLRIKAKKQRTVLYTKEVDDNEDDFIALEIKDFLKYSRDKLDNIYNKLAKATKVVYSGNVNALINKLDYKKIMDGSKRLNQFEHNLMEELKECKEKLEKKEMIYGLWNILQTNGSIPQSREGGTCGLVDSHLYVFGGFSRGIFNDVRVLDLNNMKWRLLNNVQGPQPQERFAHTMVVYDRKLIVFGGAGQYLQSIKMRLSFNDIQVFNTLREEWSQELESDNAPKKRMSHTASVMGCLMMVHGGFNTESKKLLDDFQILDLELLQWVDVKISINGQKIKLERYSQIEHALWPGPRQMHSITAIYDQDYYINHYPGRIKRGRMMWLKEKPWTDDEKAHGLSFKEGYYMFGGMDDKGTILNDLYFISPSHLDNEKNLGQSSLEYAAKPTLAFNVSKVTEYKGKPPCARISHSATMFKDYRKHFYLVIFGGRNDTIYQMTQNVALNDICMFNVNLREWTTIAMYGQFPCSRWSHSITLNGTKGDGILIFGGVNLKSYCKSKIYQFQILNKQKQILPQGTDIPQELDEKLEKLALNVKDKIDFIREHIREHIREDK